MSASDDFDEISVLIPGYSVEDLPTDLNEEPAASLLNAIAVAWHPALLARSRGIPTFRHAEALHQFSGRHLVIVPTPAEDWLPHDWQNNISPSFHRVLRQLITREQYLDAIADVVADHPLPIPQPCESELSPAAGDFPAVAAVPITMSPVLTEQFLAFGTVHVLVLLLSRRRHHYVDPDETTLTREIRAAAIASVAGDASTAAWHLKQCFELLHQTRELFYPLECHLLDLCIPSATADGPGIASVIENTPQLNLAATAAELVRWADESSGFATLVREHVKSESLTLLTGHSVEVRSSLGSLAATWTDLALGVADLAQHFGAPSRHWARRRFGLLANLPMLLRQRGFLSACHFALDDGIYPDRERAHFDWMSADGSYLAASSRIPLAIDSASSILRLPDRFCESMQDDSSAVLFLARLPELRNPWLTDLRVAAQIAPVLGRFVTIAELTRFSAGNRNRQSFEHGEYLSPCLIQSSVLKTESPITGPASLHQRWQSIESVAFLRGLATILRCTGPDQSTAEQFHQILRKSLSLEHLHCEVPDENHDAASLQQSQADSINQQLQALQDSVGRQLLHRVPFHESSTRGLFLLNSLPFPRTVEVMWPGNWSPPATQPAIEALSTAARITATGENPQPLLHVKMPAGGFVWLFESQSSAVSAATTGRAGTTPQGNSLPNTQAHEPLKAARREPPLAEGLILRNQHFEVAVCPRTGGIESVVRFGSRENRFSQHLAFRYDRELRLPANEDELPQTTQYSTHRVTAIRVTDAGPLNGEIESHIEICSPVDDSILASCRQIVRVDRYRPRIDVRFCFDVITSQPTGNPWMSYFASRFAWLNEQAAITRGVLGQTAGFQGERFESPDYVEISDEHQRLLICTHGRPYHRRTGPRMLDSLLVTEGEQGREFTFTIELDQPFPMRTVADSAIPPIVLQTADRISRSVTSGSLLGISARNVMLAAVRTGEASELSENSSADNLPAVPSSDPQPGHLRLLLVETEGLAADCVIRTMRSPVSANWIRHDLQESIPLPISERGIVVPFQAFQLKEIDLDF